MDRYEEALERAKKGLPIDEVFPELKESEDERIIDDAIQIIRASRLRCAEYGSEADKHLKAIAWLEKQKELFESGRGLYYYDGEKTTYCGYPATEENPYDFAMSQQEKQKEQKSAEWSEEDEQYFLVCKNALSKYQRSDHWDANIISKWLETRLKSIRPQSQWSEEDEVMREAILNTLERVGDYGTIGMQKDWLKSL